MGSNSFGNIFKITTWGESHGKAIGVVIDGCPAGIAIDDIDINEALMLRVPGRNRYTSPRQESDSAEILSGVFCGRTTGAPISIIISNKDADSSKYEPIKHQLRPGHANYTYQEKYGIFDYRGGGRSSARETACRVAAGAVAKKLLSLSNIKIAAYITQISTIDIDLEIDAIDILQMQTYKSPIFCPHEQAEKEMIASIEKAKAEGDSLGGVVAFIIEGVPVGVGDPIYEKIEANLAHAMLSIPASKGFEIGEGFRAAAMHGSQHNDPFIFEEERVQTATNHCGGVLGGIATGMPITGRVAFKPTSSIMKEQMTLDNNNQRTSFLLPQGSRHDPCVAIRAVPVVEAMAALTLADAVLSNRSAKL